MDLKKTSTLLILGMYLEKLLIAGILLKLGYPKKNSSPPIPETITFAPFFFATCEI